MRASSVVKCQRTRVAAALRASLVRGLRRGSQRLRPATDAGLWVTAATVGFAGGSNDGQKSMGLIVGAIVAAGWIDDDGGIPLGVRAVVAVALASATVLVGRRIAITVGRRFYRVRPIEGLAAQGAAAAVILGAGAVGAPVSTSNVVTAGVIGVGADHRPRLGRETIKPIEAVASNVRVSRSIDALKRDPDEQKPCEKQQQHCQRNHAETQRWTCKSSSCGVRDSGHGGSQWSPSQYRRSVTCELATRGTERLRDRKHDNRKRGNEQQEAESRGIGMDLPADEIEQDGIQCLKQRGQNEKRCPSRKEHEESGKENASEPMRSSHVAPRCW